MIGHWCSNRLAGRPCHFAMMNVTVAVSFGQVRLMWLNNERHRLMRERVAMMVALVGEATIVHSNERPFVCYHCYCFHSLCCSMFDLTKLVLVVVVDAIGKCF